MYAKICQCYVAYFICCWKLGAMHIHFHGRGVFDTPPPTGYLCWSTNSIYMTDWSMLCRFLYLLMEVASGAYLHRRGVLFCQEVFFNVYSPLDIERAYIEI